MGSPTVHGTRLHGKKQFGTHEPMNSRVRSKRGYSILRRRRRAHYANFFTAPVASVTLTSGLDGSDSESGERERERERDEAEVLEGFVFGFHTILGLGGRERLRVLVPEV